MRNELSGFSLIELMIVTAIIAILAGVAIPVYQGYVVKSQLSRVVAEVSGYRTAVDERLVRGQSVNNQAIGYVASGLTVEAVSDDITSFNSDGSGQLAVTLGGNAHPYISGAVIRLVRNATGDWRCEIDSSAVSSHWKPSYAVAGCST